MQPERRTCFLRKKVALFPKKAFFVLLTETFLLYWLIHTFQLVLQRKSCFLSMPAMPGLHHLKSSQIILIFSFTQSSSFARSALEFAKSFGKDSSAKITVFSERKQYWTQRNQFKCRRHRRRLHLMWSHIWIVVVIYILCSFSCLNSSHQEKLSSVWATEFKVSGDSVCECTLKAVISSEIGRV